MAQANPSDSLTHKYIALRQNLIDMEMESSTIEFSEDLFKALFMGSPVGIYVLVDGRFKLANPQFQMDTGYPLGDLIGLDSLKLVVPPDRDRVRAEALAMIRGDRLFPYEFRTEFKTGGIRSVLGSVSKITYQGERAVLGYYMDVTEQRRAHIALGASEARLRDLFDHAPVGYYEVDTDGRIAQVNRTALDMLGYTESEMTGEYGWEFMVEREQSKESLKAKMAGEIPPGKGFERTFITSGGAHKSMLMENRLIADQIAGREELNYDPQKGTVRAPWLAWGPYLWADGLKARSDGLVYTREDLGDDGTHPAAGARGKVARLLLEFLKSDPSARPWFSRPSGP